MHTPRHRQVFSTTLFAAAATLTLACSSGGAGTTTTSKGDGGGSNNSFTGPNETSDGSVAPGPDSGSSSASSTVALTVTSTKVTGSLEDVPPSKQGFFYFVVDVTLKNIDAQAAVSQSPLFFTLITEQALVITPLAAPIFNGCNPSVSVLPGGEVSCAVAFNVALGQLPQTLAYADANGDTASVKLPASPLPSAACVTWDNGTAPSCLMCFPTAGCETEESAYQMSCQSCQETCLPDLGDEGGDACACERGCDTPSCQSLFDTFVSCLAATCASSCM